MPLYGCIYPLLKILISENCCSVSNFLINRCKNITFELNLSFTKPGIVLRDFNYYKQLLDKVLVISGIIKVEAELKAEADNTY